MAMKFYGVLLSNLSELLGVVVLLKKKEAMLWPNIRNGIKSYGNKYLKKNFFKRKIHLKFTFYLMDLFSAVFIILP